MSKENQILDSALESFVSKGFYGSSTASIAEKAGVSNGTLFHYYRSKDALVQKLHQTIKTEQMTFISNELDEIDDPKERIRAIWKNGVDWAFKNKDKK